jgi:hypothetical protein
MTTTTRIRRDAVLPGMIFKSSHGYRLLVTEVLDTAEVRTDARHVQVKGHLHADPANETRLERYPAGSLVEVEVQEFTVTVHAFDKTVVRTVPALTAEEARAAAVEAVGFIVEVT